MTDAEAAPCADCGTTSGYRSSKSGAIIRTRGLCRNCYAKARWAGRLLDHPRATRPADELLADWVNIGGPRMTLTAAAERLGMKRDSLDKALHRAEQRGDLTRNKEQR